ncbi:tRNA 2-thiocytidine(32) synthetase TtcA [Afifella pfennigii]|uniref:tRNA 2-thiocytidine(32) synthetase TtcA n=1 Tax=Afifella pfennigii TaxID=209897 RepID=UPI00068BB2FD|nr:tRNA 2-thiocytidine(32) synthetase TtcA [Afifella pfennigii]
MEDFTTSFPNEAEAAETDGGRDGVHPLFRHAPASVSFKKLRKRLLRETRETLAAYDMVEKGSRWLVCLSGGKDSYALLTVLLDLQWRGLLPVELLACNLDQAQPGFPREVLPTFLSEHGIAYRIERRDTYSLVMEKTQPGDTLCALCSRLRRGHLYRVAREEGCSAVVLGHHREDALETFVMNMLFGGRLSAMPPKLRNDAGDLHVLRPLIRSAEADLAKLSEGLGFPIIPCNLCGSQEGLERARAKALLATWERERPGTKANMLRALSHVRPSHLHDGRLYDFSGA